MADLRDLAARPDPAFERQVEAALLAELFGVTERSPARAQRGALDPDQEDAMTIQLDRPTIDPSRPRANRRPRWLAAAAAAVLLAGAIALLASRQSDRSPAAVPVQTIEVQFATQWPPLGGLESNECIDTGVEYEWANNGRCLRKFLGEAQLSGDITGTALWAMIANLGVAADDNDSTAEIPAAFNGTYLVHGDVAGCGSGEFMIAEQLEFVGWASGQFIGRWQILPGSGRGDLAEIAGSGTVLAAFTDDPDASRTHTGAVSCE